MTPGLGARIQVVVVPVLVGDRTQWASMGYTVSDSVPLAGSLVGD
jgi:hypothetical protein